MKDFVLLVQVVAWPILIAAALIVFHNPLVEFLRDLGKRASKISAFHVEIELHPLAEAPVATLSADIQALQPAESFSSNMTALLEQIRSDRPVDYAVIDLGDGDRWLTSRIFLFSILLSRMRGLRSFVFVANGQDQSRRFIGTADPKAVRWSIARQCPWLELAYADAYNAALATLLPGSPAIVSSNGALDSWPATQLVQNFLRNIQAPVPPDATWIDLSSSPPKYEHARWIGASDAESMFATVFERSWVVSSSDKPKADVLTAVFRSSGRFVALVEPDRRFLQLVDRYAQLDQEARQR
ncbi:MAG TPA: hypothetical protein VME68_14885 [Acidobacteriaceae bacterium]|nr:hypothetical protein [Acidobacteriaceae bacterium]